MGHHGRSEASPRASADLDGTQGRYCSAICVTTPCRTVSQKIPPLRSGNCPNLADVTCRFLTALWLMAAPRSVTVIGAVDVTDRVRSRWLWLRIQTSLAGGTFSAWWAAAVAAAFPRKSCTT